MAYSLLWASLLGFFSLLVAPYSTYQANLSKHFSIQQQSPSTATQEIEGIPANLHIRLSRSQLTPIPTSYSVHRVRDSSELLDAIKTATTQLGNAAIVLQDGIYTLNIPLNITVPNMMLLSESGNPRDVILKGAGFQKSKHIGNIIHVSASGFVLDGITLKEANNHLIQIAAEKNADLPVIRNCILQDSYEQLLKVSYNKNTPELFSDRGLVEYCVFEYTQGIGPNYYIGGIDAHGIRHWTIRNNIFKDIASPSKNIAEYAIHIWSNASNNIIEGNVILNSDRGIGFGMHQDHPNIRYSNFGGEINDNIIYHSNNGDIFADTGIALEDSSNTRIEGNLVFLEHDYPRAIEYRYPGTNNVVIVNNRTNRPIASREGGQAQLKNNIVSIKKAEALAKVKKRLGELRLIE